MVCRVADRCHHLSLLKKYATNRATMLREPFKRCCVSQECKYVYSGLTQSMKKIIFFGYFCECLQKETFAPFFPFQLRFCFYYKSVCKCFHVSPERPISNFYIGLNKAVISFSKLGAVARIDYVPKDSYLPPFFATCNASNVRGSIKSNRVFVNDFRKFFAESK